MRPLLVNQPQSSNDSLVYFQRLTNFFLLLHTTYLIEILYTFHLHWIIMIKHQKRRNVLNISTLVLQVKLINFSNYVLIHLLKVRHHKKSRIIFLPHRHFLVEHYVFPIWSRVYNFSVQITILVLAFIWMVRNYLQTYNSDHTFKSRSGVLQIRYLPTLSSLLASHLTFATSSLSSLSGFFQVE